MELDPFEARLEFLNLLGKVNASQHSIHKVGSFAMRNKNLYEDLYSCIIEEMDQTSSINARMNLFYVLDSICQHSHKARFTGYIDLVRRNLPSIINKVTPSGPKGDVNVAATRKVLDTWRTRKIFPETVIDQVQTPLLSRGLAAKAPTAEAGLTQDDILRRMEEDRERHKRIREEIWIRPQDEDADGEFSQHWDDVSDMDEKDYEELVAENAKHLPGFPWAEEFDRWRTLGAHGAGSALAFGIDTPAGNVPKRHKPFPARASAPEQIQAVQAAAPRPNLSSIPNSTPTVSSAAPIATKPAMMTTTTSTARPRPTTSTPLAAAVQPPTVLPSTNTAPAPPLTLKSYVEATKSPVRRLSTASSSSSISSVPTTDPNSSLSSSPMVHSAAPSPSAAPPAPAPAPAPAPPRPPPPRPSAPTTAPPPATSLTQRGPPPPPPPLNIKSTPQPPPSTMSANANANANASTAASSTSHTKEHTRRLEGSGPPTTPSTGTPVSTVAQATPVSTPTAAAASATTSGGERLSLQQYLQQQRLQRASATGPSPSSSVEATTTPSTPTLTSPPPPPSLPVLPPPPPPPASTEVSAAAAAAAAGYFPVPASSGRRPSGHGRPHSSSFA